MSERGHDRSETEPDTRRASDPATAAGIAADGRRRIGRDLRLFYASVLDQPLPERLMRLVDELAAQDRNTEGSR